jgi:subtilisin family serine protease
MSVLIPPLGEITVFLQWNDPFGSSGNNYNLGLLDITGSILLAFSIDLQDGNDDPIEAFTYPNNTLGQQIVNVVVEKLSGADKRIELFAFGGEVLEYGIPEGSVYGHAAVPDVLAVGAIASDDPGHNTIEDFSSRGPSQIFFPAPQVRPKPDLVAIDKVSITGAGGFSSPFSGTSAAAPHVAGVAALLRQSAPSATLAQIRNALTAGAVDLGPAGRDNTYGWGRVDALASLNIIDPDSDGDGTRDNQDNCPSIANASQVDTDGDGQGDACDSDDDDDGMPDAFETANGFNPLDPADAVEDADGDGFTNLAEFKAGTDPLDPESKPKLKSMPWLDLLLADDPPAP